MGVGNVKTFHINMLKKYYERERTEETTALNQVNAKSDSEVKAYISSVVHDGTADVEEDEMLRLYSWGHGVQKETYKDVDICNDLSEKQRKEMMTLLEEYADIFSDQPGRTDLVKHDIKVTSDVPVQSRAYPTPFHLQQEIDKEIEIMIKNWINERSESACAAPLVVVKKQDGSSRLCCNYKQLNKITVFDPEPMMSNEDVFSKISGSKVYSKFDFSKGYYQIPMEEKSKDLTT